MLARIPAARGLAALRMVRYAHPVGAVIGRPHEALPSQILAQISVLVTAQRQIDVRGGKRYAEDFQTKDYCGGSRIAAVGGGFGNNGPAGFIEIDGGISVGAA